MNYFKNVQDLQDLKSQFKKLALQWHPDMPTGETETMQNINNEYDVLFMIYKNKYNSKAKETGATETTETASGTRSEFYTQNGWKGKNYNINLTTKEITKIIREYVKKAYPDCKFSVTFDSYAGGSSLDVCLMEAPYNVFTVENKDGEKQINHFYLDTAEGITEYCKQLFIDINNFIKSYHFDDSDIQIDYFHTNFYYDLRVGKWNKPFKVVEKTVKIKAEKQTKQDKQVNNIDTIVPGTVEAGAIPYKYEVIQDVDTRDNTQLFVLKIIDKLTRDQYIEVAKKIKDIGGYYSKFKHGFIFKSEPILSI